jgi:hypothetical protein
MAEWAQAGARDGRAHAGCILGAHSQQFYCSLLADQRIPKETVGL